MRTFLSFISLLVFLCIANLSLASIAIIVHPENNNHFDERLTRQIFLGQIKSFPDGMEAIPYANMSDSDLHEQFVSKVLKRNPNTMNAYWARMIFTAKANPPRELADTITTKKIIANTTNAISYIHTDDIDNTVKVIAIID